jgi:hypothetical protein
VKDTQMKDAERLAKALTALGWDVTEQANRVLGKKGGRRVTFLRDGQNDPFFTQDADELPAIGRKDAELGIRAWAERRAFGITKNDGQQITLVSRRGR